MDLVSELTTQIQAHLSAPRRSQNVVSACKKRVASTRLDSMHRRIELLRLQNATLQRDLRALRASLAERGVSQSVHNGVPHAMQEGKPVLETALTKLEDRRKLVERRHGAGAWTSTEAWIALDGEHGGVDGLTRHIVEKRVYLQTVLDVLAR